MQSNERFNLAKAYIRMLIPILYIALHMYVDTCVCMYVFVCVRTRVCV